MEKVKRPAVTHNSTKIKALLFLRMRRHARYEQTTAREIAIAIKGNARSLYVLLERWFRWDLVIRYAGSPFTYCIGDEGERYLSKIDNWFFSGYYSRKRKRRVLGYRGTAGALMAEITVAANAVYYAYDTKRMELFYFTAPFNKAANFMREPIVDNQRKKWGGEHLLLAKYDTTSDAFNAVMAMVGLKWCKPMGQAMVDAGLAQWSEGEK